MKKTDEDWRRKVPIEATELLTQPATKQVLQTADKIIHGDRHEAYGSAVESFNRIAALWSSYLGHVVNGHDVAMMMVLMKVSRTKTDFKLDSYVDMAGYAALGAELAAWLDGDDPVTE